MTKVDQDEAEVAVEEEEEEEDIQDKAIAGAIMVAAIVVWQERTMMIRIVPFILEVFVRKSFAICYDVSLSLFLYSCLCARVKQNRATTTADIRLLFDTQGTVVKLNDRRGIKSSCVFVTFQNSYESRNAIRYK